MRYPNLYYGISYHIHILRGDYGVGESRTTEPANSLTSKHTHCTHMKHPRELTPLTGNDSSRRDVLKTASAVGLLSAVGLSGTATAKGNNYGNGSGIGAFLNEEAAFKDPPVWDSGVTDKTGQSEVEVVVGTVTSVDIPVPGTPDELPVAFTPKAVEVSPGTDVTWTWEGPHHSVTSLDGTGESFNKHGHDAGETLTHTFDEVGNYLYYCIPHGTPYPIDLGEPVGEVENLFAMRGAVKVSDE